MKATGGGGVLFAGMEHPTQGSGQLGFGGTYGSSKNDSKDTGFLTLADL
jgi:hypothetical protein